MIVHRRGVFKSFLVECCPFKDSVWFLIFWISYLEMLNSLLLPVFQRYLQEVNLLMNGFVTWSIESWNQVKVWVFAHEQKLPFFFYCLIVLEIESLGTFSILVPKPDQSKLRQIWIVRKVSRQPQGTSCRSFVVEIHSLLEILTVKYGLVLNHSSDEQKGVADRAVVHGFAAAGELKVAGLALAEVA